MRHYFFGEQNYENIRNDPDVWLGAWPFHYLSTCGTCWWKCKTKRRNYPRRNSDICSIWSDRYSHLINHFDPRVNNVQAGFQFWMKTESVLLLLNTLTALPRPTKVTLHSIIIEEAEGGRRVKLLMERGRHTRRKSLCEFGRRSIPTCCCGPWIKPGLSINIAYCWLSPSQIYAERGKKVLVRERPWNGVSNSNHDITNQVLYGRVRVKII